MNTILVALLGYGLARIQTSDPFVFKLGVCVVLVFAALEYLGEIIMKVAFRILSENK
jgi:hypothetical protein